MIESLGLDGDQWELFSVNDNAANVKLGIKLSRHLKQYLCDIHTLELGVKDTFKNVSGMKALLKKTRAIAKFTHQSTVANSELKRAADKENILFRKIANPPNTRWSGCHDNLSSVLYMKKPIQYLSSSRDNWAEHALSITEWKLLEGSVSLLKPVRDTVKAWEAEKEPTMHRVIERIYSIHYILDEFIQNPANNQHGLGFARELKKQIEKRFPHKGTNNKFRRMANYLAPHFKGMHLEEENKMETVKEDIKIEVNKMNEDRNDPTLDNEDNGEPQIMETPSSPNSKLRMKIKQKTNRLRTQNGDDLMSPLQKEFKRFESFSISDKHVNILHWWRDHERVLPLLSKVAKKVFTIPASSSKSERVFSTGGNFVTKKRTRLASKKVEYLIVIKENKSQIEKLKKSGDYDLKKEEGKPFNGIEVDEVIQNIVMDEMEELLDSEVFNSEDEEDDEIVFIVNEDEDSDVEYCSDLE